jgi:hypothetical protein
MAGGLTPSDDALAEAAALHARAKDLRAAGEYEEALTLCRRALALHEDPDIRATYRRLIATIGPD